MLLEKIELENIKCFKNLTLDFQKEDGSTAKWVTLLGENGCGKTTALQMMALILSCGDIDRWFMYSTPWQRYPDKVGKITAYPDSHRDANTIEYTLDIFSIIPSKRTKEWGFNNIDTFIDAFSAGYGSHRVLEITAPDPAKLEKYTKEDNYNTLFSPGSLDTIGQWIHNLDYKVLKSQDETAKKRLDIGIKCVNSLLEDGVKYDSVSNDLEIMFDSFGSKVPISGLSEGYKSILALFGDLVWRMIQAFPTSDKPTEEEGVVLIDELDIHLHPKWQREIPEMLRKAFPNIQFIVATHSPIIAAGAGADAVTLKLEMHDDAVVAKRIEGMAYMDFDSAFTNPAIGMPSEFLNSDTENTIELYDQLRQKGNARTPKEELEYQSLAKIVNIARPIGGPAEPGSLQYRLEQYLDKVLPK